MNRWLALVLAVALFVALILWPDIKPWVRAHSVTPMPSDVQQVWSTRAAWEATHAVERTQVADLREDQRHLLQMARDEQQSSWLMLILLITAAGMGLTLLLGERQILAAVHDVIFAVAARRMAEAQTSRVQDRAVGTVFVPPAGSPWLLEQRPAPQIAAPAPDDPRFLELEQWRTGVLAFAWCAYAMQRTSELAFTKAGICTISAYRTYKHLLIAARVWEVRKGKGQKNDTGYVAGWSYDRLQDDLNAGRLVLPYPAGPAPAVKQEAMSNASHHAASHRVAPQEGDHV